MNTAHTKPQKIRSRSFTGLAVLLGAGLIGSILWARELRKPDTKPQPATATDVPNQRNGEKAQSNVATEKVKLSVESGRPLAEAILALQEKFGWVITYEDPRYVNAGEISDVTEQVRRDLDKFPPGQAPKVLVPKGGAFVFEYDPTVDRSQLVRDLLAAHTASGNPGQFAMDSSSGVIHVTPTAMKDVSGRVTAQKSVLDEIINLPAKERTGMQTLEDLCAAVSRAARQKVIVGTIPAGLFFQYKDREERKMKARDALAQLLEKTRSGAPLSWRLLYDPGQKIYALNIRPIQENIASD
jgi:hypothetical protein